MQGCRSGAGSEGPDAGAPATAFHASLRGPGLTLRARLGDLIELGLEVSIPHGDGPQDVLGLQVGLGARSEPLVDLRVGYVRTGPGPDRGAGDLFGWIPVRPRVALDLRI